MLGLKVALTNAEKAKHALITKNVLSHDYRALRDSTHIIFPITKKVKLPTSALVEAEFKHSRKNVSLRDALKKKLTPKELTYLKTAFDTVGNIAILEIDDELVKKQKVIANELLSLNPAITTVLKKSEKHIGIFRTQKLAWLAGKKTKIAEYKENNVVLHLNVETVYFSPRLATERKRIMKHVKNEDVLVMFSGCGPYTCVIGKNTRARSVTAIEINPEGHKYAEINKTANKLENVKNYCGDVRSIIPKLKKKFDRICMPLPMTAEDFLPLALKVAKKNAVIHFYDFLKDEEIPKTAVAKIRKACKEAKKTFAVIDHTKCGQFGPGIFRMCVDVKIS